MSNFFLTSIKKDKLNRLKNDYKISNKPTDKNVDTTSKKKNAKKFMISPVKDISNEDLIDKHNTSNSNDHIFNIVNNRTKSNYINENKKSYIPEDDIDIIDKSLSFKNNRYVSPLYTNTENTKKSISSTMSYEPLFNLYDNQNETDIYNFKSDKIIINKNDSTNNINDECKTAPISQNNNIVDKNYTSINKLNFTSLNCEPTLTYIHKDKYKIYNYNIMLDTNNESLININTEIPCYYCRRKFDHYPLGIPIKYYPSLYILNDNSLSTSKYSFNYKENTIKLNINEKERLLNILNNNPNIIHDDISVKDNKENKKEHKIITKNFFETDGIVCSFNCMVSYIEENSYNPLYHNSYNYMYLLYKHIFGEYPSKPIIRSPSWKLRKEYGGPLDDNDYNKYIQSIPIIESKQIKTINNNIKPELIFEVLV
jgi:hypothetical protein